MRAGHNMIVFMPTLGLSVAVSSLVGRYLGAEQPDVAERATWSGFWLSLAYILVGVVLYLGAARLLLAPYAAGAEPASFAPVAAVTTVLMRFVAVYSLFDTMNILFAAGLKGAGDTRFPLVATVSFSVTVMLIPAFVACELFGAGVYAAWTAASGFVFVQGCVMLARFRTGRWRTMRVIEQPATLPGDAAAA